MTTRLSILIREGAKLRPQAFGAYFDNDCSCALGAAYEAIEGNTRTDLMVISERIQQEIGIPFTTYVHSPLTRSQKELGSAIMVLNDEARWTRERIADWLESIGY